MAQVSTEKRVFIKPCRANENGPQAARFTQRISNALRSSAQHRDGDIGRDVGVQGQGQRMIADLL